MIFQKIQQDKIAKFIDMGLNFQKVKLYQNENTNLMYANIDGKKYYRLSDSSSFEKVTKPVIYSYILFGEGKNSSTTDVKGFSCDYELLMPEKYGRFRSGPIILAYTTVNGETIKIRDNVSNDEFVLTDEEISSMDLDNGCYISYSFYTGLNRDFDVKMRSYIVYEDAETGERKVSYGDIIHKKYSEVCNDI